MPNNATDYAAMPDGEVNRRLGTIFGAQAEEQPEGYWFCFKCMERLEPWEVTHSEHHDPRYKGCGEDATWIDPDEPPDYCSPSAPVSLRIEMVEAVVKAGSLGRFSDCLTATTRNRPWGEEEIESLRAQYDLGERDAGELATLSLCLDWITATQPILSRAVLCALESTKENHP